MNRKLRDGTVISSIDGQDRILSFFYETALGRILLKPLICPWVSRMAGSFLSSFASRFLIRPFIRSNDLDMTQFEPGPYRTYNDFFARKIRPEKRPIDRDPMHLISPCDSKLTVLPITQDGIFTLKHTPYTLSELLKDPELAVAYEGGYALIFRLTVDDYHRYCFPCDGEVSDPVWIPGVFHTVNPIANDHFPIYKENTREYCVLHTKEFEDILMMEVGALLVGKIVNHPQDNPVLRGREKGYFQFGGSTVVLLVKKDTVQIDADLLENSREGYETVVRYGERIGSVPLVHRLIS